LKQVHCKQRKTTAIATATSSCHYHFFVPLPLALVTATATSTATTLSTTSTTAIKLSQSQRSQLKFHKRVTENRRGSNVCGVVTTNPIGLPGQQHVTIQPACRPAEHHLAPQVAVRPPCTNLIAVRLAQRYQDAKCVLVTEDIKGRGVRREEVVDKKGRLIQRRQKWRRE